MDRSVKYTNTDGQTIEISYSRPFILTGLEGFGAVTNEIASKKVHDFDGAQFVGESLVVRDMSINCRIIADSQEELSIYRKQLESAFNPQLAGTLYFEEFGKSYSIDVKVEIGADFDLAKTQTSQEFQLVLKALDPRWRDTSYYDSLIPLSTAVNKFKFPLVITDSFVFASMVSGQIIEINNTGDYAVGGVFTIKIMGPVKNPRIYNVLTQHFFGFSGDYDLGTTLTVITVYGKKKVRKVVDGVETNAMSEHMSGSDFIVLEKGSNYLQIQADSGVNSTIGELNFTPLVVGV